MEITDDLGRLITIDATPVRIISLVPSITELLFDLNLESRMVGTTKFCVHPDHARKSTTKIGGTKTFDFDTIKRLEPDLIIANKEENYKEGVEFLTKEYPTYVSDIFDLDDAIRTIQNIGSMTGQDALASALSTDISVSFNQVKDRFRGSVLYFIWQSPYMVAAADNFIDYTLKWIGMTNAAGNSERYPEFTQAQLTDLSPDYVFLSSEPYPFKQKHVEHFQLLFPQAKVLLVDGEMFSWYGSRLKLAPKYFMSLPLDIPK